jgi:hypothetical protein
LTNELASVASLGATDRTMRWWDFDGAKTMASFVARKSGGANFVHDAHAPINFHGAGVAPLHFRQKFRSFFLLEQRATHAAPAQIDGKRQTHGAGANDENLCIQTTIPR